MRRRSTTMNTVFTPPGPPADLSGKHMNSVSTLSARPRDRLRFGRQRRPCERAPPLRLPRSAPSLPPAGMPMKSGADSSRTPGTGASTRNDPSPGRGTRVPSLSNGRMRRSDANSLRERLPAPSAVRARPAAAARLSAPEIRRAARSGIPRSPPRRDRCRRSAATCGWRSPSSSRSPRSRTWCSTRPSTGCST